MNFKCPPFNYTVGQEEHNHAIKGQVLGPLYFPAHIMGGIRSMLSQPHPELLHNVDSWHRNNFMETDPMHGRVF